MKAKIKLTECKTLEEAIRTAESRKAHPSTIRHIKTAFNVNDPSGKVKNGMLKEAEEDLQNDEDKKAEEELKESLKTETEDNRKTGQTAQSDGRTLEEQKDKKPENEEGPEGLKTAPGGDQLGEAIDQVADVGSGDPMNTCIITKMNSGMSEVEAQNACAKEVGMMEAVVTKKVLSMMKPILAKADKKFAGLSESIKMVDGKIVSARKDNIPASPGSKDNGLSLREGVMPPNVAANPSNQNNQQNPQNPSKPMNVEEYRRNFTSRYYIQ